MTLYVASETQSTDVRHSKTTYQDWVVPQPPINQRARPTRHRAKEATVMSLKSASLGETKANATSTRQASACMLTLKR